MERIMKKLYLALVFSSFFIISGCSENTSDEYTALAEAKIQQDDFPSAIIELKNAIGVDAQDARSRFLLGNLYANRGSAAAAEKELFRALELGYEPNEVLPVLANAYSLQFKHAEIIKLVDESRNLAPEVSTSLLLYKALAHFQLGEPYQAKKAVADANEISSDSLYSKLGSAYVDFSNSQINTSLEKINEILKVHPDFADAHLLKGQLTSVSNDKEGSVKSFEKYKNLLPDTYQSRVFLANAYLKNNQFEEAEKEVDLLLEVNSDQAFVNQMKGVLRFKAKDFVGAKLYTEKAIQNGFSNDANRIIAGISSFQLKNYEQAYQHLSIIQDNLPAEHPIQKLLAMVELKLGRNSVASDKLIKIDGLGENDILLLSAASAQLMLEGKTEEAKALLEKSKTLVFSDPLRIAQRGILSLSLGDIEGIADLTEALEINPELDIANTALARAFIDGGLYEEAISLSDDWIEKKPDEVNGYVLAAMAYYGLEQITQTEVMFNRALMIDAGNPAANIYFADKAVSAQQPQQAINSLQKIVNVYPDYIPALKKYYLLQRDSANTNLGLKPIEEAFNRNQKELTFGILFAQALFTDKRYDKTIDVLEQFEMDEVKPNEYWIILGNAYFYTNQPNKTLLLTQQWVTEYPLTKEAHLRLIALNEMHSDNKDALEAVKKAQRLFQNDPQFDVLLTHFYLVNGDVLAAKNTWDNLTSDIKSSAVGQGLHGQILIEQGTPREAIPKLKTFYKHISSDSNASLVAKAMRDNNQQNVAVTFLQAHQQEYGESIKSSLQLAELAITSGDYTFAVAIYKKIIIKDKDNIRALNNLAYLLMVQESYAEAVIYAKAAVDLLPKNSSVLDTYATVLLKLGRAEDSVKFFDKAFNGSPDSIKSTIHYAEALILMGENLKAAKLFDGLSSTDSKLQSNIERVKAML